MPKLTPLLIAAVTTFAFYQPFANAETYPKMTLRLAHQAPSNATGSEVDQWFADEIEKRSEGQIKIKIFWSESMGKATEILGLVSSGAIDLGATSLGYFPDELPLSSSTNAVMMQFDDNGTAARVTDEMIRDTPEIQDELQRANIHPIFFHSLAAYRPICTKPLKTDADFKGAKMRAWGRYVPKIWESLGAVSVNVLTPDMYSSLQHHTLDCSFWTYELANDLKLAEVAKYTWPPEQNFGAIPTWPIIVNWDTWNNKWTQDIRDLFNEVGQEAMERDIELTKERDLQALSAMQEKGMKVVEFEDMDAIKNKVPNLAEIWISDMEKIGKGDAARKMVKFWTSEAKKNK